MEMDVTINGCGCWYDARKIPKYDIMMARRRRKRKKEQQWNITGQQCEVISDVSWFVTLMLWLLYMTVMKENTRSKNW